MQDAEAMYANWYTDPDVTKYLIWPPHTAVKISSPAPYIDARFQSAIESFVKLIPFTVDCCNTSKQCPGRRCSCFYIFVLFQVDKCVFKFLTILSLNKPDIIDRM